MAPMVGSSETRRIARHVAGSPDVDGEGLAGAGQGDDSGRRRRRPMVGSGSPRRRPLPPTLAPRGRVCRHRWIRSEDSFGRVPVTGAACMEDRHDGSDSGYRQPHPIAPQHAVDRQKLAALHRPRQLRLPHRGDRWLSSGAITSRCRSTPHRLPKDEASATLEPIILT